MAGYLHYGKPQHFSFFEARKKYFLNHEEFDFAENKLKKSRNRENDIIGQLKKKHPIQ